MKILLLCVLLLWGCGESDVRNTYTAKLFADYHTTQLMETQAQAVEIQGYLSVVKAIAAEPPVGEISDSVAYQIALAIYKDSQITNIPGSFYLALIRVENPWMNPWIENWYGAVGLTQVVPRYWEGIFPECGEDIRRDIYTQICYGARIYHHYLERTGDPELALYAYNGCTRMHRLRNARCINYPRWVMEFDRMIQEDL